MEMKAEAATLQLNPWFSMWSEPRKTIQQIIGTHSKYQILLLSALYGISMMFTILAPTPSLAAFLEVLRIIIFGIILGIIFLYLKSWCIHYTGCWIGGKGTKEHVRAAYAWSAIPMIWLLMCSVTIGLILNLLLLLPINYELITVVIPLYFMLIFFSKLAIAIVSLVIWYQVLGQVQGFSAWRAFGNDLLADLLLLIAIFAVIVILGALWGFIAFILELPIN